MPSHLALSSDHPPVTHGLLVRQPWADLIVQGKKTWEIRGRSTSIRGRIAVIAAGTGTIVGLCDLLEVVGPLSLSRYRAAGDLHCIPSDRLDALPYVHTYAWRVGNAVAVPALKYNHPPGAVIWVRLDGRIADALGA